MNNNSCPHVQVCCGVDNHSYYFTLGMAQGNQALYINDFLQSAMMFIKVPTFKKQKTCTAFLLSYRNMTGSLGEQEMLLEHELQATVSTAFLSSPYLSQVFLQLDRNMKNMFSISFRKYHDKKEG